MMTGSEDAPRQPIELGCVTGRFQPPHAGHRELIELALSRHSSVVIGVTNPDRSARASNEANPERHRPAANPFTYFERVLLLRALMDSSNIDPSRFIIVPFPLGRASDCRDYVPHDVVQYVRVYSDWELRKVELLRDSGYRVHAIEPEMPKQWSAGAIRKAMVAGADWRDLVPQSTVRLLNEFMTQRPIQERQ